MKKKRDLRQKTLILTVLLTAYTKIKRKLKKQSNTNFYVQDDSNKPLKKRLTSGSNSQKFLTKAALKHSDDDALKDHEEPQEMKSLLLEEEEVDNFNISFNNSSKNDS